MIPSLRQQFNENFTADKYRAFLRRVDEVCGTHVQFRLSETPCFFPKMLLERMADDGQALIRQLMDNPAYRAKSDEAVPPEFKVPNEAAHPMFAQVDFGLVRDAHGELQPKLVELQAFPSLYAYQGPLAQAYIDGYGLRASGFRLSASGRLKYFLSGLETASYRELLRRAGCGGARSGECHFDGNSSAGAEDAAGFLDDGENARGADRGYCGHQERWIASLL